MGGELSAGVQMEEAMDEDIKRVASEAPVQHVSVAALSGAEYDLAFAPGDSVESLKERLRKVMQITNASLSLHHVTGEELVEGTLEENTVVDECFLTVTVEGREKAVLDFEELYEAGYRGPMG